MADKKRKAPVRRTTPADKIQLPERGKGGNRADPKAPEPPLAEENYYRLKTQAVEDLVTANEENSPPVPRSELRKYHAAPRITVADWIKALLLKFWAAGMVCYFFIWGLSTYAMNQLDHLLVLAIALGMVTNLIVSNIFRFIAKTPGAYDRWMMFPKKGIVWLPADLVYAAVLILCVLATYNAVNAAAARLSGLPDAVFLGVEPLMFGVFTLLWDLLFLGVKRLFLQIVSDAKSGSRSPR